MTIVIKVDIFLLEKGKVIMLNEMDYVKEKIESKEYKILPDTIADGVVYKVSYQGSLEEDGYEMGFLFLPKGSGIKKHKHIEDIEQYVLVSGNLSVGGEVLNINTCLIGGEHNIDIVLEDTIVATLKLSKRYVDGLGRSIDDVSLFEEVRAKVSGDLDFKVMKLS